MNIPHQFDAIRPFEPEELPKVFNRILDSEQFRLVLTHLYPHIPIDIIAKQILSCKTNLEFQQKMAYPFLDNLLRKAAKSCDIDIRSIDNKHRYTFVSNHRDIVLDSAFLCKLLMDNGFQTTCEIAIGDNLLSLPWVKDLVRINKSFIVERSLSMREKLLSSKRLAEYMHFVIQEKHDNVWIAQREGRAKDSDDRTSESILKMMSMGGEGSIVERLTQLHIVPMTISYEYDPCDYLKAAEFQLKRDNPDWKKGEHDDVMSMQTGIMGYKGNIHYHCASCIDDYLQTLDTDTPKTEIFGMIAQHIDREIHRHYRLFPNNYVALDMLNENENLASNYSNEDKKTFETYTEKQLSRIDIPNKDYLYLRKCMLTMYANPLRNYWAACK